MISLFNIINEWHLLFLNFTNGHNLFYVYVKLKDNDMSE